MFLHPVFQGFLLLECERSGSFPAVPSFQCLRVASVLEQPDVFKITCRKGIQG